MPSIISPSRHSTHKAISLLLLTLFVPVLAYGAGLGRINVKSALGEPLNADIELLDTTPQEAAGIVARIANNDEYLTAGLQDAIVPAGVRVTSVTRADGSRVLHVTTPRAVNEPFLELLIRVDSDNLHLVRQFTVLLDPPMSRMPDGKPEDSVAIHAIPELKSQGLVADGLVAEVPPAYVPRANRKARTSHAEANHTQASHASNKTPVALSGDTYQTQPGDVFGKVAQQYQPAGVPLVKVMAAFYAANPEAFRNGDMNQLKAGQTLKVPSPESLGGELPTKAQPAMVEVPPPAAPKPASPAGNPEFVLKISPDDTSGPADKNSEAGEPAPDAAAGDANPPAQPEPEPVAPAAAAPAPVPAPTIAAMPPKEEPGFFSIVLDRLLWISLGLLLGLASLGLVYYLHLRRLVAMQKWHESMVQTNSRPHPNDVEPYVVKPAPFMAAVAEVTPSIPASTVSAAEPAPDDEAPVVLGSARDAVMAQAFLESAAQEPDFDIHEVDPMVEAEIYISYGRDEQAEHILLNALEKTPDRHELTLCLLKIYAERRDAIAFDQLALRLQQAAESGSPEVVEQWHAAAVLGHKLSPHHPLYNIEGITDQEAVAEEEDNLMLPELEPIMEEVEPHEFEPLHPLSESNVLEFTFEKIKAPDEDAATPNTEEEQHDPLFPTEKK